MNFLDCRPNLFTISAVVAGTRVDAFTLPRFDAAAT